MTPSSKRPVRTLVCGNRGDGLEEPNSPIEKATPVREISTPRCARTIHVPVGMDQVLMTPG
ncbi:hypothetical protein M408DRAFT_232254 [Serendipita vermifera MAFF 305830]|uniref:Uncharacterized protein n=1 Tax=Serendipita vermifera MAFF 305830 TaxID=933852 RepID=A0A0C3AZ12_SERVB|nr:hypothetical protein M408DRAFT_232254 [Serendipita vermifera MAFF 305830]